MPAMIPSKTSHLLAIPLMLSFACGGACLRPGQAQTVLDIVQIACVLATDLTDERHLAQVCGVADDMLPEVRKILSAKKVAAAKRATAAASASASVSATPSASAPVCASELPSSAPSSKPAPSASASSKTK